MPSAVARTIMFWKTNIHTCTCKVQRLLIITIFSKHVHVDTSKHDINQLNADLRTNSYMHVVCTSNASSTMMDLNTGKYS